MVDTINVYKCQLKGKGKGRVFKVFEKTETKIVRLTWTAVI